MDLHNGGGGERSEGQLHHGRRLSEEEHLGGDGSGLPSSVCFRSQQMRPYLMSRPWEWSEGGTSVIEQLEDSSRRLLKKKKLEDVDNDPLRSWDLDEE